MSDAWILQYVHTGVMKQTRRALFDIVPRSTVATDMMVWNITRDNIRERMAVSTDNAWSVARAKPPLQGEPGQVEPQLSEEMEAGAWDVSDVESQMVREYMEKYNIQPK